MRPPVPSRVGIAIAAGLLAATSMPGVPSSAAPPGTAGMIVFLDPGHSGAYDASMTRPVPTGRGGTKACQTSGTAGLTGYPEHSVTWDTTLRIRQALTAMGVRTAMSRGDDNGPGPCVNERAAMANALHPNAIVSVHADGGPTLGRGFHVNYAAPPLNTAQAGPSVQLARVTRDALQAAGFPPANYIGDDGLKGRADLAGLNLAQYPSVLVELGNMKNPTDGQLMESPTGRQRYAEAIARGVAAFLASQAVRTTEPISAG